jgi:hypothetical protein
MCGKGENKLREIKFIGDISTTFLCGSRCFLLFQCRTLDSYLSIVLASICFSKLLKDYTGPRRNSKICIHEALKYVLVVHEIY